MLTTILLEAHNAGPMTGRGNNTFLLISPDGEALLIDAGVGDPRHLDALSRELSSRRARLTRVLVTHGHPDHASGAPELAAAFAAQFAKFPWTAEDARYHVRWQPLADRDTIVIGNDTLIVLHTPGHSPDHVAFWHEPTRTAYTGDLVIAGGSVAIPWSHGGDVGQYLVSLQRLLALDAQRLLPAHGPEVTHPARLLRGYLEHRRDRERQILHVLGGGPAAVPAIAESIYDGLEPALAAAAHDTVRAHLEKLRSDGRVIEEYGRWRLEPVS